MKKAPTTNKTDVNTTIQELKDTFTQFREERGWKKYHTPHNLSVSIAIEAAELMEHFQWGDYDDKNRQEIADELADIISYCLSFADIQNNIDISTAFRDKLERVKKKYPLEIFNPNHDDTEAYMHIKKAHRQGKQS